MDTTLIAVSALAVLTLASAIAALVTSFRAQKERGARVSASQSGTLPRPEGTGTTAGKEITPGETLRQIREIPENSALSPSDALKVLRTGAVASAVLETRLEMLETRFKELDSKLLTKWDVASITFTIITALGGTIGAVLTVTKWVAG